MKEWWLKLNFSRLSLVILMTISAYFGYNAKSVWWVFSIPAIALVAFIADNLFN